MNAVHQKLAYGEVCTDVLQEASAKHGIELFSHQNKIETLDKRLTALEHIVQSLIKPTPPERDPPPKIDTGGRPFPPIHEPPFPDPRPPILERGHAVETKPTKENDHDNDNH